MWQAFRRMIQKKFNKEKKIFYKVLLSQYGPRLFHKALRALDFETREWWWGEYHELEKERLITASGSGQRSDGDSGPGFHDE